MIKYKILVLAVPILVLSSFVSNNPEHVQQDKKKAPDFEVTTTDGRNLA